MTFIDYPCKLGFSVTAWQIRDTNRTYTVPMYYQYQYLMLCSVSPCLRDSLILSIVVLRVRMVVVYLQPPIWWKMWLPLLPLHHHYYSHPHQLHPQLLLLLPHSQPARLSQSPPHSHSPCSKVIIRQTIMTMHQPLSSIDQLLQQRYKVLLHRAVR